MRQGVSPQNVLVVDTNLNLLRSKSLSSKNDERESIYQAVLRERSNHGLGKVGQSLVNLNDKFEIPSSVWGVSCFPPLNWDIGTAKFSKSQVAESYRRVAGEMEIQAEESSDLRFPISGEEIGKLKRKSLSNEIASIQEFSHSRLAIRTRRTATNNECSLTGNCFVSCPNSAPWNPFTATRNLLMEFPDIQYQAFNIVGINIQNRTIETPDSVIRFEKLYLGVGAIETHRLLQMNFPNRIKFDTTPVVILPLYFKKRQNVKDYYNSFLFTDLIVSDVHDNELRSLTQIYLPTKEITARVISRSPRIFHKLLAVFMNKPFSPLFQRIGVAMIFLQSTDIENQTLNSDEFKKARKKLSTVLRKASIRIIPGKREHLLNGASYHYGSIRFADDTGKGVDSQLFLTLAKSQIFLTDTSALPYIPPGPHSSISMALAKLIVENSLK